jgi:hypothetical protein
MNIKTDKKLIQEALKSGCTTAAQLAHYLKVHALIARTYQSI